MRSDLRRGWAYPGVSLFEKEFALVGRHTVVICRGVDCHARGRQILEEVMEDELGVRRGQTTVDQRFTMQMVDCLDICDRAPAMRVNDDYYGPVHPDRLPEILTEYE